MFVGREEELNKLYDFYNTHGCQAALLYGKRRVGKTQLILESLKKVNDKFDCIYYQCTNSGYQTNINNICDLIKMNHTFNIDYNPSFKNILEQLALLCNDKPIILVIDEYQTLNSLNSEVDSVLQWFIDHHPDVNIKIVLSGSYISLMKNLIEIHHPLYGRFRQIILLNDLPYYEAFKLCPSNYSIDDKIKQYAVFGGTPHYYTFINHDKNFTENLITQVIDTTSPLGKETDNVLMSELKKINYASDVFNAVAHKKHSFNDIKSSIPGINSNELTIVLNKLIDMELIKKVIPINYRNSTKKAYYVISDGYFSFYYTFIFNKQSQIVMAGPQKIYENYIKEKFEKNFVPFVFEKIAMEYIKKINIQTDKFMFMDINSYVFNDKVTKTSCQFDLVGLDNKDVYTFFEVKYTSSCIDMLDVMHLNEQVLKTKESKYKLGFISKSGFSSDLVNALDQRGWYHFDLNDLLK